ncbi:MAG: hypothetical protein E7K13_14070, partial [Klebsiella grimontii]|nr:hypothetical protein [Klebsiella grimontii]
MIAASAPLAGVSTAITIMPAAFARCIAGSIQDSSTAEISSPPLLRREGISKRYGATRALNNVRFDLFAGEVHALMG